MLNTLISEYKSDMIESSFNFFIVVQLQLSPFPPNYSPTPYPAPPLTLNPPLPLSLSMGPLYMFLDLFHLKKYFLCF